MLTIKLGIPKIIIKSRNIGFQKIQVLLTLKVNIGRTWSEPKQNQLYQSFRTEIYAETQSFGLQTFTSQ